MPTPLDSGGDAAWRRNGDRSDHGQESGKDHGARRFQRRARQEADKEALRTLILETARREFAMGTLETVSIQKIADAIGYSKAHGAEIFSDQASATARG